MDATIEDLFPDTPDAIRAILTRIRRMAQDTLPEATEFMYHGALGYGPTSSGFDRIIYVAPQNGYANLGFFFGTGLSDPTRLLEGSGKRMRHVKIRSVQAAATPEIVALTRDAWTKGIVAVAQLRESRKKRPANLEDR